METPAEEIIKIPRRRIKALGNDPEKTATIINLVYVHDFQPGIMRIKKGKGFEYRIEDKKLTDKTILQRIKGLVIPPAWENVWICMLDNGHLQATGQDTKKRKQYKYHPLWNALRNQTKYYRLPEFGKALPAIRHQLEKDIRLPGIPVEKVLALIVMLMERTNIRIGNNFYEKLYGSFGLTTLKDNHVSIKGSHLNFLFKGKKGVKHNISIRSKRLSALVKKCRDIPGKELFQYYDESGMIKSVDSGMVNDYIKKISGTDFSAKDFRTWSGTLHAFLAFKEVGDFDTDTDRKKKMVEVLDIVAKHLGNTRTVCKKYYVHPQILSHFENKSLEKYFKVLDNTQNGHDLSGLTAEEEIVMKILEAN